MIHDSLTVSRRRMIRDVHPRLHNIRHARGIGLFWFTLACAAMFALGVAAGIHAAKQPVAADAPVPTAPAVLKSWGEIGGSTLEFRPAPMKVETL